MTHGHPGCDECAELETEFGGRTWTEINTSTVRNHNDCLPLFTPEAFQYFLPAFLLAAMDEPDSCLEFTLYSLCDTSRRAECSFTPQQRLAIAEFARWAASLTEDDPYGSTDPEQDVLRLWSE